MLSAQEQADLYTVYAAVFGDDPSIKSAQNGFNEETAHLIQTAVIEATKCNASMKGLVVDLLDGTSILAKGWLRKGLKKFSTRLKEPDVNFNGYACLVMSKAKYRAPILETAY